MRRKLYNFLLICFLCIFSSCDIGQSKKVLSSKMRENELSMYNSAVLALKKKNYKVAKELFEKVADIAPFSSIGEEAKASYTKILYDEGKFAAAAGSAEGYLLHYPSGARMDQILSIKGNAYFQMSKGRTNSGEFADKARDAFTVLVDTFPTSEYVTDAQQKLLEINEIMAEKIFSIGSFYFREMSYHAAIARFDELVRDYSGTKLYASALSKRAEAYKMLGIDVSSS
ncbi:outer membrane protein assembly factor BamD [Neorickettsia sp. 179522]|uniref:outer membrane protein assembly factor BamD n=1 Tax=Neorickettsia sp. 179522 TaxID=1714371 RepID=UPI0007986C19|nr:outer membrane protein assembly factor BamD [Neorickettsia sp. 179522]KYH12835.1 competence protein ComL [Neorickettsia sp. 179522]